MEKGAYRNNFCRIEDEDEDERMRMMIMRMKIRIMRMETISPTMTYLSRWWRMHWNNFGGSTRITATGVEEDDEHRQDDEEAQSPKKKVFFLSLNEMLFFT